MTIDTPVSACVVGEDDNCITHPGNLLGEAPFCDGALEEIATTVAVEPPTLKELAVERKKRDIRRIVDKEIADEEADESFVDMPLKSVTDFLTETEEITPQRVEDLMSVGTTTLLSAQAKTGKTSLVVALAKCLVDGGVFLNRFKVAPVDGKVVFINLEMSDSLLRDWFRRADIKNTDKLLIVNMRGDAGALDFRNEATIEKHADALKAVGAKVVIIDTLSKILDAVGINEDQNSEMGPILNGFDVLMKKAELSELIVVHHMGHKADRARGASKLLAWADGLWNYTINKHKERFLSVTGRDVELAETQILFNPTTHELSAGSGIFSPALLKSLKVEEDILKLLADKPGLNTSAIKAALGIRGEDASAALSALIKEGGIRMEKVRSAHMHYLI
jgi:hypothetical protein